MSNPFTAPWFPLFAWEKEYATFTCEFEWDGGAPVSFAVTGAKRWTASPATGAANFVSPPGALFTEDRTAPTVRGVFMDLLADRVNTALFDPPPAPQPAPSELAALTAAITYNEALPSCRPLVRWAWRSPVSPDNPPKDFTVRFLGSDEAVVAAMNALGFHPDLPVAPTSNELTWEWNNTLGAWALAGNWNDGIVPGGGNIAVPDVWAPFTYSYAMEERDTAVIAQTVSPYAAVARTLRWGNERKVTRFGIPLVGVERVFDQQKRDTRWLGPYAESLLACSDGPGFEAVDLASVDGAEQPYLTWGTFEQMIQAARNGSLIRAFTEWGQPESGVGVRVQVRDYLVTDEATLGDVYNGATDDTDRGRLFTCGFEGLRL